MGTVVDENNPHIDPEEEVRKLQDLVKRLEHQNQVLRSKNDTGGLREANENIDRNVINTGTKLTPAVGGGIVKKKDYQYDNNKTVKKSLNDIDVIDLDNLNKDDDDSWLYTSPTKSSVEQKDSTPSPYDWMRQDLEEASPRVATAKRSLVFKLNEVARIARSPSSGAVSSSSLLSPSPVSSTPISTRTYNRHDGPIQHSQQDTSYDMGKTYNRSRTPDTSLVNTDEEYIPKIRKPLKGLDGVRDIESSSRVNTNTFRKKKSPYVEPTYIDNNPADSFLDIETTSIEQTNNYQPVIRSSNSSDGTRSPRPTPERDANANQSLSRNSSIDNSSDSPRGSDYKLTDVVDVRVLARMQEDSLRQSMNSPKIQRKTVTRSRPSNENSGYGSSRSSPGRYLENDNGYQSMGRSNASLGSLSSNSDSPASSPYGSQYLESIQTADGHRRSMPNLAKTMPLSLHTVPSDPQLSDARGTPRRSSNPQQQGRPPPSRYGTPGGTNRYQGTASTTPKRGTTPQQYQQQYQNRPPSNRVDSSQRSSLSRTAVMPRQQQQQYLSQPQTVNSPPQRSAEGGTTDTQSQQLRTTYRVSPQRTLSPQRGNSTNINDSRNKSPHRSGLPSPRSATGIPRPGSASKLPGPRKSTIPTSRRAALFTGSRTEDSWKDGCY